MTWSKIWTPRRTTQLWPPPNGGRITLKQCTFHPTLSTPNHYEAPPPPPPVQRIRAKKKSAALGVKAADLTKKAKELQKEADRLEKNIPPMSLPLQFGSLVLDQGVDAFSKRYLKEWDQRGRGEVRHAANSLPLLMCAHHPCFARTLVRVCDECGQFLKGEFRNNLRSLSLNASSTEADALFDSWDEDGGGSLDLDELRQAFKQSAEKARKYHSAISTGPIRVLRERAASANEAAECAYPATVAPSIPPPISGTTNHSRLCHHPAYRHHSSRHHPQGARSI